MSDPLKTLFLEDSTRNHRHFRKSEQRNLFIYLVLEKFNIKTCISELVTKGNHNLEIREGVAVELLKDVTLSTVWCIAYLYLYPFPLLFIHCEDKREWESTDPRWVKGSFHETSCPNKRLSGNFRGIWTFNCTLVWSYQITRSITCLSIPCVFDICIGVPLNLFCVEKFHILWVWHFLTN